MSTFGGYMPEFPDIRVDYFCQIPGRTAPLACFLSHVHSDHLQGLDNDRVKLPFVYCSAATKEILLRLEKRRDRLNLAQGILEKERRTYKHLKSVLKPIPLETPTLIELAPKNEIRVTLFDANHCTGAVMFLFERENTAVLYTGDIRSEPWFVNNLTRNPFLIEYTCGMKTLDCIYLDTSNTGPMGFPTKAEGLKELIGKVRQYPPNTKFHFSAWTFGYEEVWAALSRTLDSQIHVDKYKIKLYQSLRQEGSDGQLRFLAPEGPLLAGCVVGNGPKEGCLTTDKNVRIHSCEKGMGCSFSEEENIVLIRPIITRLPSGVEIAEVGIGGGWGDLVPNHELAMDPDDIKEFLETVFAGTHQPIVEDIRRMLLDELSSTTEAISLDGISLGSGQISLKDLGESLLRKLARKSSEAPKEKGDTVLQNVDLPKVIKFPYSRHSSYPELRHLVEIFNPKDVYPCTVDKKNWDEDSSIEALFGDHCSASIFRHDTEMRHLMASLEAGKAQMSAQQTQTTDASESSPIEIEEHMCRIARRWEGSMDLYTPTPAQKSITGGGRKPLFSWNEDEVTSSVAPPSQKNVDSIRQTPRTIDTHLDSSSASQVSRRRVAAEMISPPSLKRVRLSEGSQLDGSMSSKSPTPSTAASSKQQSQKPSREHSGGHVDLTLPLTTLMDQLGNVPALCRQVMNSLFKLNDGELDIETYVAREQPNMLNSHTQIVQVVPPPILSAIHRNMIAYSQIALDALLKFQEGPDIYADIDIDIETYFNRQSSPLQYLVEEFKIAAEYLEQRPDQRSLWDSTRRLNSMSDIIQPGLNGDADRIRNQGTFTLVENKDFGSGNNDGPSDDNNSSSVSAEQDSHDTFTRFTYPIYDERDNILRCGDCGHEIWESTNENRDEDDPGFCTGCERGIVPFYEEFNYAEGIVFPRIYEFEDDESEAEPDVSRALIGDSHLDYQSDAYDTQDEDSQLIANEEYEVDSFIDDDESASVESGSDDDDDDDNDEMDYKTAFQNLQKEYADMRNDYFELVDEYAQFKFDMLGTSEEEGFGDDEDVVVSSFVGSRPSTSPLFNVRDESLEL